MGFWIIQRRFHLRNTWINEKILLKLSLKELVVSCPLAQNTNQWPKLINAVKNILILKDARNSGLDERLLPAEVTTSL
jgi:hypothetical protein